MKSFICLLVLSLALFIVTAHAQDKKQDTPNTNTALTKPQQVMTTGAVTVEGNRIDYNAYTGTLILKNDEDKPACSMFYVAYVKKNESDESKRPVTFIYNGGPGSSTMWLHMSAWGPHIANLKDTARVMAPYKTVNNDYSLLDASDLVFVDAPGTGLSQIITKDKGGAGTPKEFFGIDQDANAFASFITKFLSTYNRWDSPKYLFGESYGTFRSAALSNILETQDGVDLNGVILLSQLLNYNNMSDVAEADPGMGLPYELALPSAAATAWYHHKLPNRPAELEPFLKKVENFSLNEYAVALNKGSMIDSVEYNKVVDKLHEYTGLSKSYIRKANLRISGPEMEKNILADEGKVTGRLDTRFSGFTQDPLSKTPKYDPHGATFEGTVIGTFNNYLRTKLNYGQNETYHPFGENVIGQWDFHHHGPGGGIGFFPNVMPDLANAMIFNPKMKVMLNMGYYDLGTPFFEGVYEMHHLPIPDELQKNISYAYYKSGHMVYLHPESLKKLHDNVAGFIQGTH